jgi:hypothetical protein
MVDMKKLKGLGQIVLAIGFAALLFFAWDYLGTYYVTLKFLPNVPLLGARLVIGLGAVGFLITGVVNLVAKPEPKVLDSSAVYQDVK